MYLLALELNQKGFSFFLPRNIQYRARLKGPLQFFQHCETFKKTFIKGSPIHQYFGTLKSFCYF